MPRGREQIGNRYIDCHVPVQDGMKLKMACVVSWMDEGFHGLDGFVIHQTPDPILQIPFQSLRVPGLVQTKINRRR